MTTTRRHGRTSADVGGVAFVGAVLVPLRAASITTACRCRLRCSPLTGPDRRLPSGDQVAADGTALVPPMITGGSIEVVHAARTLTRHRHWRLSCAPRSPTYRPLVPMTSVLVVTDAMASSSRRAADPTDQPRGLRCRSLPAADATATVTWWARGGSARRAALFRSSRGAGAGGALQARWLAVLRTGATSRDSRPSSQSRSPVDQAARRRRGPAIVAVGAVAGIALAGRAWRLKRRRSRGDVGAHSARRVVASAREQLLVHLLVLACSPSERRAAAQPQRVPDSSARATQDSRPTP